jgi:hypothetical protein
MPLDFRKTLLGIQPDRDGRVQITDDPMPAPVRDAGLDFGRNVAAIGHQTAIDIAQDQVDTTFRVVKTETDVLQANFTIQGYIPQARILFVAGS